jgi:hypothetical protein
MASTRRPDSAGPEEDLNTPSAAVPPWLAWLALVLVALLSLYPLFWDPHPTKLAPQQPPIAALLTKGSVLLALALVVTLRAWGDRSAERRSGLLNALFVLLAVVLTAYHWYAVDCGYEEVKEGGKLVRYYNVNWQRALYAVLNHRVESHGEVWIPQVFRPLPYGFTRSLELWTGDWAFACLAYRTFFTYWFIWGFYRFVRLIHPPKRALVGLAIYAALYPLSMKYYMGQLTDPMSHAFFVLALLFLMADRWLLLAAAIGLGVLAKETAVVLVPAYLACWWQGSRLVLLKTTALGVAALAAFFAARLPFELSATSRAINGSEIMVLQNLGLGKADFGAAPVYQNYLHPVLFIGLFLPLVVRNWRRTDHRLRMLVLTLTPLIFLTSLAFSWLHESRNYMPLLPLLVTMAAEPPGTAAAPLPSPSAFRSPAGKCSRARA